MNVFQRLANLRQQHLGTVARQTRAQQHIDQDLPHGFHVGAIVTVSELPFALASQHLLTKFPGADHTVVAYGKFNLFELAVHQFYLLSPANEQSLMQITCNKRKVVESAMLFRHYDVVSPQSAQEWTFWIGDNGVLGQQDFFVEMADGFTHKFYRAWGDSSVARVEPVNFQERIIFDPYGNEEMRIRTQAMLYHRQLTAEIGGDQTLEYLFVCAQDDKDGARIQINTGIPIDLNTMTVI